MLRFNRVSLRAVASAAVVGGMVILAGAKAAPPVDPNRPITGTGNIPAETLRALPEHMRPGRRTLTLHVGDSRGADAVRADDGCEISRRPLGAEALGWGQFDGCGAHLIQRAVLFDTTLLDQMPDKLIERAILTYDEERLTCPRARYPHGCWTNGEGTYEYKLPDGCVDVRVPDEDWRMGPVRVFATAEEETALIRRDPKSRLWDVTVPFSRQAGNLPLGAVRRYGFLLSGWPRSLDQLTADDSTHCISRVTNVQLHVTYNIPPAGPGFVPPN